MDQSHQISRPLGLIAFAALVWVSAGACGPRPTPNPAEFEARVSLLNKSHEMHVLRIRELRPEVALDCELVAQAPAEHLTGDAFGSPVRWPLFSGQEIGLGPNSRNRWGGGDDLGGRQCNATLIQSDTVADIVVFWDRSLPPKRFAFDPDIPEHIQPDPQSVVLRGDYEAVAAAEMKPYRLRPCDQGLGCGQVAESVAAEVPAGARYYWESVSERALHFERPWRADERPQTPSLACEMPGAEASLIWEQPQGSEWIILGVREGIDGCHTIDMRPTRSADNRTDYVVCAPFATLTSLAPRPGRAVFASFDEYTAGSVGGLRVRVRHDLGESALPVNVEIYLLRGRLPEQLNLLNGYSVAFEPRATCAPVEVECGQADVPVDLRLDDRLLSAGDTTRADVDGYQLHLVRALRRSVVDSSCADDEVARSLDTRPGHYVEAVIVLEK